MRFMTQPRENETKEYVKRVPGAKHKKMATRDEALAWYRVEYEHNRVAYA
jgi:viroplasmin and RNaseH domain-containing protein